MEGGARVRQVRRRVQVRGDVGSHGPLAPAPGLDVKEGYEVCSSASVHLRRKCGWGIAAFLCVSQEVRFGENH